MVDPGNPRSPFGFGYEETVHADGADPEDDSVVPGSRVPVSAYDPAAPLICLPLGRGGAEVHETWELVNLATETHNFHIHQTKFSVLDAAALVRPGTSPTAFIREDNVPVPFANADSLPDVETMQNGYCTIDQWGSGRGKASQHDPKKCLSRPVLLDVPFSQPGEFVFHCHILDHEDGGMMAKIKVVRP
jgi:FtsP/CotA-like multicopper oxidase with cupredoxin domain